ncbi:MAG TPA: WD40 repeat domain-containing protein [Planctomycetota bacterium]|nr:WD40 repeat domain-containing protein [Planctomycetota bacterium]
MAEAGYTSFVSRRALVTPILLILTGAGIAVAIVATRPGGFVPGAFVLEQTLPLEREDGPVRVAFVPGNRSVIYEAQRRPITIFDLATGTKHELFSDLSYGNFALSADGASAAIMMPGSGRATTDLRIYDLASGKVRKTLPDQRGGEPMTWSPDGQRIVFAVMWMLFILDLERGNTQNLPISDNHGDWTTSLAFSPDGRLLGVGTQYGEVSLWRTDSWTLVQKFNLGSSPNPRLGPNAMCHVTFSPDGSLFAAGGGSSWGTTDLPNSTVYSGALRVWRTSDHTVALSMDTGRPVVSLSFSPDGATLAYHSWGQVQIVDLGTGREICHLEARTGWNPSVEFGRDGRLLTLDERGGIRIWKRAS